MFIKGLRTGDVIQVEQFGGQKILSIRVVSDVVASGGYANILKGEVQSPGQLSEPPMVVAIKVIVVKRVEVDPVRIRREISAVTLAQHRHILPFIATLQTETYAILVTKFMGNGNMAEYLDANPGAKKEPLILEVSEAVDYLHSSLQLVHGDLKCQNVLVSDDGHALLTDFGLSTTAGEAVGGDPTLTSIRASMTLRFAAPEIILETATSPLGKLRSKTIQTDVYAIGMLIIQTFTGAHPWPGLTDARIYRNAFEKVRYPRPTTSLEIGLTDSWWQLCETCLKYEPDERPSMGAICSSIKRILDIKEEDELSAEDVTSKTPPPLPATLSGGGASGIFDTVYPGPSMWNKTAIEEFLLTATNAHASAGTEAYNTKSAPDVGGDASFQDALHAMGIEPSSLPVTRPTRPATTDDPALMTTSRPPSSPLSGAGKRNAPPPRLASLLNQHPNANIPTRRNANQPGSKATAILSLFGDKSNTDNHRVQTYELTFLRFDQITPSSLRTGEHIPEPGFRAANAWLLDAIRGPQRVLEELPPVKRNWLAVLNAFETCPLLIPSPAAAIDRTDEYTVERRNWFGRDENFDSVGNEPLTWFARLLKDFDVEQGPGAADMRVVHDIVADARKISEWNLISKERQTITVQDIGVLRYPDISYPYIKVYRIELVARYEFTTVGAYTRNINNIIAKFNLQHYETDKHEIEGMRARWRQGALDDLAR